MANHKSAEKRARQTKVRTERNRFYKTRIKNVTKTVIAAIEAADKEAATAAVKTANKYLKNTIRVLTDCFIQLTQKNCSQ